MSRCRRICAVNVESCEFQFLLVCVYMPVDGASFSEEFDDVISEISGVVSSVNHDNVIIGGDFN